MLLTMLSWATGCPRPQLRSLVVMPIALIGLALALDVAGAAGAGGASDLRGRWAEIGAGIATNTLALPVDRDARIGLALLTVFYGIAITSLFVLLPKLKSARSARSRARAR